MGIVAGQLGALAMVEAAGPVRGEGVASGDGLGGAPTRREGKKTTATDALGFAKAPTNPSASWLRN